MGFLKYNILIFPEREIKVIPLVRPFPLLLTPFTYNTNGAERVPNNKEYTHEMLMEYYWIKSLMKIIPSEKEIWQQISLSLNSWV